MKNFESKNISTKEAKQKAANYCAYQERSLQEVKDKLQGYGLTQEETEKVLDELIDEKFVDEARFARSFAQGKLHRNKWGKIKITRALQQKGVKESLIQSGFAEIDDNNYQKLLQDLIDKKKRSFQNENEFTRKHKIARYVIGKGFEPDLVWELLGRPNF